ncbi:MAG: hypothetical protein KGN02_01465, partial [bacterium]|nr:hypothetical protein [bacterium]
THYTLAQLAAHRAAVVALIDDFSRVDDALNVLSAVERDAPQRAAQVESKDPSLASKLRDLAARASGLVPQFTSNPQNDQDDDFLVDVLRERLQTHLDTYFDSSAPPTAEQLRENRALHALTVRALDAYEPFARAVDDADAHLRAAGLKPLARAAVIP